MFPVLWTEEEPGELSGHRTTMVAGVRYERTEVDSTSQIRVPTAVVWTADNDFRIDTSATNQPVDGNQMACVQDRHVVGHALHFADLMT